MPGFSHPLLRRRFTMPDEDFLYEDYDYDEEDEEEEQERFLALREYLDYQNEVASTPFRA